MCWQSFEKTENYGNRTDKSNKKQKKNEIHAEKFPKKIKIKNVPSNFRKNRNIRKTFCQVYKKSKIVENILIFFKKLQITKNDHQNF